MKQVPLIAKTDLYSLSSWEWPWSDLLPAPKYWDYRHASPHLPFFPQGFFVCLFSFKSVCMCLCTQACVEEDLGCQSFLSTLFQAGSFTCLYARLAGLLAPWEVSCLCLPSHSRSTEIAGMCYYDWLYLGSGDLDSHPPACMSKNFNCWAIYHPVTQCLTLFFSPNRSGYCILTCFFLILS